MTPEKTSSAEDMFAFVLDLPESERREFLDRRCGRDAELRAEVESLLRWHELAEAGSWDIPGQPGAALLPALAQIRARTLAFHRAGPFQLQDCLGEGATGIVYRALDTRSGQTFALKIASPQTMLSPAGRDRFTRAAEAGLVLAHKNIARVLETGVIEDLPYVVLEYVEGRTLADELKARNLDAGTVLRLAGEIADALQAAHRQGIIHRDLKPANIMITRDGDAKVLDFGLCHAFAGAESIARTESGVALGTLGYMAPEQAHGLPPTPQSDLFSFGAVLYEMLAGQRAFRGDTPVAILSSVLHDFPERRPGGSWPMDLALWCLEKDPARRPRSAAQVRAEIQRIENRRLSPKLFARRMPLNPRKALLVAAVSVALAIGAPFAYRLLVPRHVPVATPITPDENARNSDPAISLDRKWIAFASNRGGDDRQDLWITPAAGGVPRRVTYSEINARQPEFSPDGRALIYRSDRDGGGIFRARLDGRAEDRPPLLAPGALRPRFSPDGKRIVYWNGLDSSGDLLASGGSRIYAARADGSEQRQICPGFAASAYPVWSPDGSWIAFAGRRAATDKLAAGTLWVTPFGRCQPVAIGHPGDFPNFTQNAPLIPERWLAGGRLVFRGYLERELALGEVVFSERTGHIIQPARQLALPVKAGRAVAVLDETTVAYTEAEDEASLWSIPLDSSGTPRADPEHVVECASTNCIPALSSDGSILMFSRYAANRGWEMVRRNLRNAVQETVQPPGDYSPWPFIAGKRNDFLYSDRIVEDMYNGVILSESTRSRAVICPNCPELWDVGPSEEYALSMAGDGIRQIGLIDLPSGRRRPLLSHPKWSLYRASFSQDEKSVLFTAKLAPDRSQIFVCQFHDGRCDPEWIPVTSGTEYNGPARWSASGDLIYFASQVDGHRCFYFQRWDRAAHRPAGPVIAVRHFHASSRSPGLIPQSLFGFAVSRDKLVFPMAEQRGRIWLVH